MAYAKKVDLNHKEVVEKFRELGASVFDASGVGRGFPDIVVGYNGQTVLVEIKSGERKRFSEAQLKFMAEWKGSAVTRINDVEGVIRLIKILDLS
jgi:Holliday junction resolvase